MAYLSPQSGRNGKAQISYRNQKQVLRALPRVRSIARLRMTNQKSDDVRRG